MPIGVGQRAVRPTAILQSKILQFDILLTKNIFLC